MTHEEKQLPGKLHLRAFISAQPFDELEALTGTSPASRSSIQTSLPAEIDELLNGNVPKNSASFRLLRSFLDLGGEGGPIHARALDRSASALFDPSVAWIVYQNNTPSFLRDVLIRESQMLSYHVNDPRDLSTSLRTVKWSFLCGLIENWNALDPRDQVRTADVVNRLGMYRATCALLTEAVLSGPVDETQRANLILLRANALIKTGGSQLEIERLLELATHKFKSGTKAKTAASLYLVVHHAKFTKVIAHLDHWGEAAMADYREMGRRRDTELDPLFASIFLRGLSFVPFRKGDHRTCTDMLDDAEDKAKAALASTETDPLAAQENMFALLETRIKEALALGRDDLSLERAERMIAVDPLDPRPHIHLGTVLAAAGQLDRALTAFLRAAELGAPYTPRALFQAAQCQELLDDQPAALRTYVESLRTDPGGVSSLLAIHRIAGSAGLSTLRRWAATRINELRNRAARWHQRDAATS